MAQFSLARYGPNEQLHLYSEREKACNRGLMRGALPAVVVNIFKLSDLTGRDICSGCQPEVDQLKPRLMPK